MNLPNEEKLKKAIEEFNANDNFPMTITYYGSKDWPEKYGNFCSKYAMTFSVEITPKITNGNISKGLERMTFRSIKSLVSIFVTQDGCIQFYAKGSPHHDCWSWPVRKKMNEAFKSADIPTLVGLLIPAISAINLDDVSGADWMMDCYFVNVVYCSECGKFARLDEMRTCHDCNYQYCRGRCFNKHKCR